MENPKAQPTRQHIPDDEDDSVELDKCATQVRRHDFRHPDGHCGEDHEGAGASEEARDQEHGDVHAAG
jgi:hypothetical protein